MTQDKPTKKYPASTGEVAKMLGLVPADADLPMSSFSHSDLPVANLPVVAPASPAPSPDHQPAKAAVDSASHAAPALDQTAVKQPAYASLGRQLLPYVAIFTIGVFLYYFFFSSLNLNINLASLMPGNKSTQVEAAPQQSAISQLEQQDLTGYYAWINGFYYDVKDPKIIDPNTDNSGNGLTNFEKYLLNLNPKSYDTLGLGMADSQDLAQGISPITGGPLTASQSAIIAKYIDMEAVNNRLALYTMENPGKVAGADTGLSSLTIRGTQPIAAPVINSGQSTSQPISPTSSGSGVAGSPTSDSSSINIGIHGQLIIPNLKVNVPIIWSQDPADFETDLQSGVVHYPGTAMPGDIGTTYIAGHSSNYSWAKGGYNEIFSHLDALTNGTAFQITATTTGGKQVTYHYVVVSQQQYSPTDQTQFQNTGKSLVALSTCWPVGSTSKRLVVFAQLLSVDK